MNTPLSMSSPSDGSAPPASDPHPKNGESAPPKHSRKARRTAQDGGRSFKKKPGA